MLSGAFTKTGAAFHGVPPFQLKTCSYRRPYVARWAATDGCNMLVASDGPTTMEHLSGVVTWTRPIQSPPFPGSLALLRCVALRALSLVFEELHRRNPRCVRRDGYGDNSKLHINNNVIDRRERWFKVVRRMSHLVADCGLWGCIGPHILCLLLLLLLLPVFFL